ncbi:MAG: RsmB/NOP family class I SAM-dependent RNA methyltransferase [Candidatus Omnitrophica bacterium]|nr:RsmB/NOP family class I SAM-dependent RNA methyltransferase [Candidatus Omnitrophota bacterium]
MDKLIYRLPSEFRERIKEIYPHKYFSILNSFLTPKLPTFRINKIKVSYEILAGELKKQNIKFKEVSWYKGGFVLIKPSQREFEEKIFYREGWVYFQNLSSILAVWVLSPEPQDKILDLCSAPGGKTTQIISDTQGKAEVLAVEKIKPRYYKLLANLRKQAQERLLKIYLGEGALIYRKYPQYFDKVLLDAPCSSEANFLVSDWKTFSYWSYRKIKEAQYKQRRLLFSGIESLKKGGSLLYSTCTFSPEENEEVVNWTLEKFKPQVYLEEINLPIPNYQNGLTKWRNKSFSQSLKFTKRILPTEVMEGFFLALFRKR